MTSGIRNLTFEAHSICIFQALDYGKRAHIGICISAMRAVFVTSSPVTDYPVYYVYVKEAYVQIISKTCPSHDLVQLLASLTALSAESPEHLGGRGLLPYGPLALISCLPHLAERFFMTHFAAKSKHGHRWYLL
jgi:hypothetical protein